MKLNQINTLILKLGIAFSILATMNTVYASNCDVSKWGSNRCAIVKGAYDIYNNRNSIPYNNNDTKCGGTTVRAQSGTLSDYTAKNAGTDCSGLAFYAYKQANLNFTHSGPLPTHNMITQMIELGGKSEAKPGDLVFWAGTDAIDYTRPSDNKKFDVRHVGVYIGNGQVIDTWDCSNGPKIRTISTDFSWANGVIGYYKHKNVQEASLQSWLHLLL